MPPPEEEKEEEETTTTDERNKEKKIKTSTKKKKKAPPQKEEKKAQSVNSSGGSKKEKPKDDNTGKDEKSKAKEKKEPAKKPEYNPRWYCYTLIIIASLINLCAASFVNNDPDPRHHVNFNGNRSFALFFGTFTFAVVCLILLLDRTQLFIDKFNYSKDRDGMVEGGFLLFLLVLWIIGVGYQTKVEGIAYRAMNVYFSSWLTLFLIARTLDEWSTEKDYLSWKEMTSISKTDLSWYILFFSSMVVLGTCIDMMINAGYIQNIDWLWVGITFSAVSTVSSICFILFHYKILDCGCKGKLIWAEISFALLLTVMWIVCVYLFTSAGHPGSTIVGEGCTTYVGSSVADEVKVNCTVIMLDTKNRTHYIPCEEAATTQKPGSNLYVFSWICLASTVNLVFEWKAEQAIRFANAQEEKALDKAYLREGSVSSDNLDIGFDEFEDADQF